MPLLHARYLGYVIMVTGIMLIVSGTLLAARSISNTMARMEREKERRGNWRYNRAKWQPLE